MTAKPYTPRKPLAARIQEHSVPNEDGCWVWQGVMTPYGYGAIKVARLQRRAHRVSYEAFVGPIPEGLVLDHLCRNRACVNPAHLEPVTNAENVLRGNGYSGRNHRATQCIRGHEFTPENTMRQPRGTGRMCRICKLALNAGYKARRRALRAEAVA